MRTQNPVALKCSVEGCDARPRGIGLCALHYQRWYRYGRLERVTNVNAGCCVVSDCSAPMRANGLCRTHYERVRNYGRLTLRPKRTCRFAGCGKPHAAHGWCNGHYERFRQGLDPNQPLSGTLTLAERFWAKVDIAGPEECWLWTASISATTGYGQFDWPRPTSQSGRSVLSAHRVALALYEGVEPPTGLHSAHSCPNRHCVNPAHLRWATPAENEADKKRGFTFG